MASGRQTAHLVDVPAAMKTGVVFDQSRFVRTAIETLLHEGGIGLFLTCVMISDFPRKLARDRGGVLFDSALGLRDVSSCCNWAAHRLTAWCWAGWRWRFRG